MQREGGRAYRSAVVGRESTGRYAVPRQEIGRASECGGRQGGKFLNSDALGAGDPRRAGARTALRRKPHALRLRDAHSVVGAERRASGLYSS